MARWILGLQGSFFVCLGACWAAVVREEETGAVCESDVWGVVA